MANRTVEASTKARRPRNSITLENIVTAAIGLADDEGIDALSVRRVAARIGCAPMSVYTHVPGRADLELAMLEAVTARLDPQRDEADARTRLHARLVSMHDLFATARWALQLLIAGDLVPENSFAFADACIGDLLEVGLAPADAIYGYGLCWHLVLGELLDRHPAAPRLVDGVTQRESALRNLDLSRYPNYAHVIAVLDPADAPPPCQIERSLTVLLDGILSPRR